MTEINIQRSDLELVFGVENIKRWADLDGDGDETKISARIQYAIETAIANFNDVMRQRQYKTIVVNATIVDLVARIAALKLYDGRELIDGDPTADKMSIVRTFVNDTLLRIRRGEITLDGERTSTIPTVVPVDSKKETGGKPASPFYGLFAPNTPPETWF